MQIFLESINIGIWDVVLNGPFIMINVNDIQQTKAFAQWTADESRRAQYDVSARNIVSSVLTLDELQKIFVCTSACEMWEILCLAHERTDDVK